MGLNTNGGDKFRDAHGRFKAGHPFSQGHVFKGGRHSFKVKAMLREAGLEALPRIRVIATDKTHRDYFNANKFLVSTGLKDIIDRPDTEEGPFSGSLNLPGWGTGRPSENS